MKKGNPDAFKDLFRLLYSRLKGYCSLFISDQAQIEDIIQESFIALWEKRKNINTAKSVESFVFVIVRNRCLNYLKKIKIENNKVDFENEEILELQHLYQLDLLEKEEISLEEMLIVSFQKAVDELPEKMKQAFVRCKIEGQKQKDVAEELGISIKMVEKHIANAKLRIRNNLIDQYPALIILITLLLK